MQESYDRHRRECELSRQAKTIDSNRAKQKECITACYDMQSILPTPSGDISQFYYKRRLSTYNFTIYNMGNGTGFYFIWHEGQAKRGPNEIGSCVNIFLKKNSFGKPIIFYSGNCTGQNKNKFIVSLYMYAVMSYNIPSISHKFLITGHTQNEGDHMH